MIKEIKNILFKVKSRFLNDVFFEKGVYITKDSQFQGANYIHENTMFISSKLGFASYIGADCKFYNTVIGKYCSISDNVRVIINDHPIKNNISTHPMFYNAKHKMIKKMGLSNEKFISTNNDIKPVNIGNDVWIGEGVTIFSGVKIGDGAVIGAKSLVIKDVQPYEIVAGIPAKRIRFRFNSRKIEFLLNSKWWDNSLTEIEKDFKKYSDIDKFMNDRD